MKKGPIKVTLDVISTPFELQDKENQLVVYQKSLGALFQTREPFSGQWTLQRFFQVLIKTCKQISINTAGKRALKLWNLPSSNVIRPKRAKILLHKVAEFYKRLYGGGGGARTCPRPPQ